LKFNTYCSPCHDRTGSGQGIVAIKTPTWQPSNLVDERVRAFNDGELYNVITHGRRSMPSYRFQIAERDRWAVVAYVRALQRAATGTVNDVPQELKAELR
jgi:mono/diheme cytochrome c family protein